jgi:23S rRNA pseudouridine1911/1915/1917 synthase
VFPTAELREHCTSIELVARFAKGEPIALSNCVCGKHQRGAVSQHFPYSRGFAVCQVRNQPGWAEFAAHATFDVGSWWNDSKVVPSLYEQFAPPRRSAGENDGWLWCRHESASYNLPMLDVLYEDNHLLVVNKPAMLPTMGVSDDRPSLLTVAKDYLRQKYNKPGNVYLGIVSRLDAPVTGVVLLARTSKAAGRLSQQFRDRDVDKFYWAIVEGPVGPSEGNLVDYLRKDERHRKMHVTASITPDAQRAELTYRVLKIETSHALLEIRPLTGRKHQIRLQLSHAGLPILGDRKYGSTRPFAVGIALHSRRLVIEHPVSKMQLEIEAPLPATWQRYMRAGHV